MDYKGFANMLVTLMKPRYNLLKQSIKVGVTVGNTQNGMTSCSRDQIELLEAFKRIEITCIAREQFKYGELASEKLPITIPESNERIKIDFHLTLKLKTVIFDLRKLTKNFCMLCNDFQLKDKLVDEFILVSEIEKMLQQMS